MRLWEPPFPSFARRPRRTLRALLLPGAIPAAGLRKAGLSAGAPPTPLAGQLRRSKPEGRREPRASLLGILMSSGDLTGS